MSEDVESMDEISKQTSEEEVEKELDNNSSGDESVANPEEEDTVYGTWKENAKYLYDLLIHHHTQWPCLSCGWGPVSNDKSGLSVTPFSQYLYMTTHTGMNECWRYPVDGSYCDKDRKWANTPEAIVTTKAELARKHETLARFIGKFNESQKHRNISNMKSIAHPGLISRIQSGVHFLS